MVTAKSLQMLDTLGNNISPAVNIETVYYEREKSGIIYREHLFKHFPVYLKYSGHPEVEGIGSDYHTDILYQAITDYHASMGGFAGKDKYAFVPTDGVDWDYAVNDALTKENKGSRQYSDILVSGVVQSQLADTDYFKLDVSTYNLTSILSNYAPKEWVSLNLDYLGSKVDNNARYQSPAYIAKRRQRLQTLQSVGGLEAGVDVSTLCGETYSTVIDNIITPVKNPSASQARVKLQVPKFIHIEKEHINKNPEITSKQKLGVTYSYDIDVVNVPVWDVFKMGTESLDQPKEVVKALVYTPSGAISKEYTKNSNTKSTVKDRSISVPLNVAKDMKVSANIGKISINYPEYNDEYLDSLQNSIGRPAYNHNGAEVIQYLTSNKKLTVSMYRLGQGQFNRDPEVKNYDLPEPGKSINHEVEFKVTLPILHGHDLTKLKVDRIYGQKYHQIYTKLNPRKLYYVCVPRCLVEQLVDPMPHLYKILQQSKWQHAINWRIMSVESRTSGDLAGFTVFTIGKMGIGATKDIKFIINTTTDNLLAIKQEKTKAKNQTKKS